MLFVVAFSQGTLLLVIKFVIDGMMTWTWDEVRIVSIKNADDSTCPSLLYTYLTRVVAVAFFAKLEM